MEENKQTLQDEVALGILMDLHAQQEGDPVVLGLLAVAGTHGVDIFFNGLPVEQGVDAAGDHGQQNDQPHVAIRLNRLHSMIPSFPNAACAAIL